MIRPYPEVIEILHSFDLSEAQRQFGALMAFKSLVNHDKTSPNWTSIDNRFDFAKYLIESDTEFFNELIKEQCIWNSECLANDCNFFLYRHGKTRLQQTILQLRSFVKDHDNFGLNSKSYELLCEINTSALINEIPISCIRTHLQSDLKRFINNSYLGLNKSDVTLLSWKYLIKDLFLTYFDHILFDQDAEIAYEGLFKTIKYANGDIDEVLKILPPDVFRYFIICLPPSKGKVQLILQLSDLGLFPKSIKDPTPFVLLCMRFIDMDMTIELMKQAWWSVPSSKTLPILSIAQDVPDKTKVLYFIHTCKKFNKTSPSLVNSLSRYPLENSVPIR